MLEGFFFRVKPVQPSAIGTYPQYFFAFFVGFVYGVHRIIGKAIGVKGLVAIVGRSSAFGIKFGKPAADSPYPHYSFSILVNAANTLFYK